MKKFARKWISATLAVLMLVCSAPLNGFVGLDLSDFTPKASAVDNYERPDNWVDYSDITPNQYMAKVLLNHNYLGTANSYDPTHETVPQWQLEYYKLQDKMSLCKPLVDDLKKNNVFMSSVASWEYLTFNPANITEDKLDEIGYYTAIIMSVLDTEMGSSEVLDTIKDSYGNTVIDLTGASLDLLKDCKDIDISTNTIYGVKLGYLSDSLKQVFSDGIARNEQLADYYEYSGKGISFVQDVIEGAETVADVTKTLASFIEMSKLGKTVEAVLNELYKQCPESNVAMKAALSEAKTVCSDELKASIMSICNTGVKLASMAISRIIGDVWKECISGCAGGFVGGLLIGQVIGKSISNFFFSTDKIVEQFYVMNAALNFENVMVATVDSLAKKFKQNESAENADNFIQSIKMMFSTYTLDLDYSADFIEIGKSSGLYNKIRNGFGADQTVEKYKKDIQFIKDIWSEQVNCMTNLEGYRWYYEYDAPIAYNFYFETKYSNVTPAYSKNVKPVVVDIPPTNNTILKYRMESDGTVSVIGCMNGTQGKVVIPSTYADKPIRKIANGAFKNCTDITEVVFGDFVYTVEQNAFYGCSSLSKVTLNSGLQTIGYSAFSGTAITNVTVPNTVTSMGISGSGYSCFYGAKELKTVTFEYGIMKIPSNALYGCSSVTNVIIPGSITEIGSSAFYNCTGLTSVTLLDGITKINTDSFTGCSNLTTVRAVKNSYAYNWAIENGYNVEEIACSHSQTQTVVDSVASCDTDGVSHTECKVCKEVLSTDIISAIGHNYEIVSVVVEADCKTKGLVYEVCSRCGDFREREVPEEHKVVSIGEAKEATCTEKGMTAGKKCSVCGTIVETQKEVPAKGHSFGEWVVTKEATCIEDGEEQRTCIAGDKVETRETTKLSHIDSNDDEICDLCKDILCDIIDSRQFGDDIVGKLYANGVLVLEGTGETYAYARSIGDASWCDLARKIIVKEGITYLGNEVFSDYNNCTDITLPNSLLRIGDNAFGLGCESILIPSGVEEISATAFDWCENLNQIKVDSNNKYYSDIDGILFDKNKTELVRFPINRIETEYTIPNGVKSIGEYAFSKCGQLEEIVLIEGLEIIKDYSFEGCYIRSINVPSSVNKISYTAFNSCRMLGNINVDSGNKYYCDIYGILFNKEKTEIIRMPENYSWMITNGEYSIPKGVTNIGNYAFSNCSDDLEKVNIPDSVTNIGDYAFNSCIRITEISIPENITSIGVGAFYNCHIKGIEIPIGVTEIKSATFAFSRLENITIPSNVKSIGDDAFYYCKYLTNVNLNNGLEAIYYRAFFECDKLETITIPKSISIIDRYALGFSKNEDMWPEKKENFIIKGFKYTVAKEYADNNGFDFVSLDGDSHIHNTTTYTQPSTCKVTGYTMTVCSICGEQTDFRVLPLSDHTFGKWVEVTPATIFSVGMKERTCSICSYKETEEVPKLPSKTKTNKETGISVTYGENSFGGDITVEVSEDFTGRQFLGQSYGKFESWNIAVKANGKEVQPKEPVYVKIPVPKNFDVNRVAVYHINTSTGKAEKMDAKVENGYICFYTSSFSPYVLVDESTSGKIPVSECGCKCHSKGFTLFIWKISNFFHKLFRMNKYHQCACGNRHW